MTNRVIGEYSNSPSNFYVEKDGEALIIRLFYPPRENELSDKCKYIYINQESVRASDGIRLHYDYEKDSWIIEQPTISEWDADKEEFDEGWTEVAAIKSWALQDKDQEMSPPACFPDYVYDPDEWEFTATWKERDILRDELNLWPGEIRRIGTLMKGPDMFVAEVALTVDEDGCPEETEIQWFASEEEAKAAIEKGKQHDRA